MNIPNIRIAGLHACYVQHSGLQVPLNKLWGMEYEWGRWAANGWGEGDLALVIQHIKRTYSKDFVNRSLRWDRLIRDHEKFAILLAEAKATARNAPTPQSPRDKALASLTTNSPEVNRKSVDGAKKLDVIAKEILEAGYEQMRKAIK